MRPAAFAAVLAFVLFSGCYASTEPATEIQTDSVRLNAHGTANNGPASSWFEYEPSNGAGFLRTTDSRTWPAGASGPFSERVRLLPNTPYSFRVCGRDEGQADAACANRRSFKTAKPVGDGVYAVFWFAGHNPPRTAQVSVDATSGAAGQQPRGSIHAQGFSGFVTCLAVQGERAAVVSVGQRPAENDPGPEYLWYTFAEPGRGLLDGEAGDGVGPDCRALSLEGDPGPQPPALPEIAIWDSP
jgi:hypothetical protein